MDDEGLILLVIVAIVLGIIFLPFVTIWSMNTLFPALAIAYTFKTWLAMLIMLAIFTTALKFG